MLRASAVPWHTTAALPCLLLRAVPQLTGRFSGTGEMSHWERKGLPSDRGLRQMSHYFDVSQINQNRQQAKKRKGKKYAATARSHH